MQALACRTSALAVTMLFAACVSAAAQDYAGREKLRAQSNEFRKEVIRVTDGVYVAVGYSASNVILVQGEMPGDDFFRAFPNIGPIRGARLRTPEDWIASLEKLIALGPEHVVPSHTRPVLGGAAARTALTAYRDGIKSILDQTIQGMRQGERPDELVQHVKLPPHLAENPYLQEFYGDVEWTVRAIYADRVSWFDGNATNLFPLPERDRAAKLVRLIGGPDQVVARAHDALAAGEFKWAAELADYVLANDSANAGAKRINAQALIELGERQINAIARNYYLSPAMYLLRDLPPQGAIE